ncbi:MAG: hypothetical protein IJR34_06950 [Bacteroidales bacterium]|nr:hypothetical protein [Bacteroidales bacterium]
MKKILLFAVALALPLLFSCKKDNKDAGSAGIPSGASYSTARTFQGDGMWATFNGDKTFVAGKIATKDVSPYEVIWGTYTFENNVYTMYGEDTDVVWATLEVLDANTVKVTIGKTTPVNVPVSVTQPAAGNDNQRAASHTWKPVSLTLVYKAAAFNSTNGVNLNAFEDWAVENKLVSNKIFDSNMVMKKVIISDAIVSILFDNGQTFVGHIPDNADLAGFTMQQITVKNTDNLPLFQGKVSISFSNGMCVIGVNGTYQGEDASAVLTLSL